MKEAVIVGAVRTPVGRFGGRLKDTDAPELGAVVIAESLRRSGLAPAEVSETIMGNVLGAGSGQNPARQAAMRAGIPPEAPALSVNMVCGSGLRAVALAAAAVRAGAAEVIAAGGMESMSRAPFLADGARWGCRLGHAELTDCIIRDGLWDVFNDCHMASLVEELAAARRVTREDQDRFALASQAKAKEALETGRFSAETVPVPDGSGETLLAVDEFPRPETTLEKLAALKPAFKRGGTITAGNASGINDGAAAVIVTSAERAKKLRPALAARIVSEASSGIDPKLMGLGPLEATGRALALAGLSLSDIDLVELNEAFAAQSLAVIRALDLEADRVNVNGGAIALGHPIGASGARIMVTLLHELKRRGKRFGLATLCVGGGMGVSMVVENISPRAC